MQHPFSRRLFLGFATTLGFAAAVAGWAPPVSAQAARERVSIGTQIWPGALPIYVAIAKGYTGQHGIDIDRIIASSGANRRSALLAGEIHFAEFAFSNVAVAAARNAPIKYVMSTHDFETFSLMVRAGLKDQVKSVADLKGKIVGFTTPGSGAWAWAKIFLSQGGLNADHDVQMLGGMSDIGVVLTALKTNKIDAHISWEPITTTAISDNIAYALVPIWEADVHRRIVGATALGSGLTTTDKILSEKPQMAEKMVAAVKEGLKFINANSARDIARLLSTNERTKPYWGGFKPAILEEMIEKSRASFKATTGEISRSGVDHELKLALDAGVIKTPLAFDKLVDSRFAGTKP